MYVLWASQTWLCALVICHEALLVLLTDVLAAHMQGASYSPFCYSGCD